MLRRIGLLNFKCFERLDLQCGSLNLLCGLNGMGKSSVIQALLVLRQSFRAGHPQDGRLVLGGALTDLGAGSDVLFEDADDEVVGFVLNSDRQQLASTEFSTIEPPWAWAFRYSRTGDHLTAVKPGEVRSALVTEGAPPAWRSIPRPEVSDLDELVAPPAVSLTGKVVPPSWCDVPPFGGRLIYVQAERVGPRKWYPLSEVMAHVGGVDASGEYALELPERQTERAAEARRSPV